MSSYFILYQFPSYRRECIKILQEMCQYVKYKVFETCVRCFKEIWKVVKVGKVGKVDRVGKVGREGLIMPTWNQLLLLVNCGILAISWQDL